MKLKLTAPHWFLLAALMACVTTNPAWGLLLGVALGLTLGNDAKPQTSKASKLVLQWAVTFLGFSMSLKTALQVGVSSAWVTAISIGGTLLIGMAIMRLLGIDKELSLLLSGGTAICGGSAIAAFSTSMKAHHVNTAVSLAVIFVLNGVALVLFPPLGHFFGLNQEQFGFWAALAIHDTSSVVGAGAAYGEVAAQVATVVKLTRALWIIPLSFLLARLCGGKGKLSVPAFLVGFLVAAALRSVLPQYEGIWHLGSLVGKRMMVASLLLIGAGLTRHELQEIGFKPLLGATLLWFVISALTLLAVKLNLMPTLPL